MLLSFDTKNQIITRTDANRAIANSTDYFEVSVTFSANWNGYDKTICFKNGDTEINIMLVNNAVPKEAHLNLGVGTWKVSIIGIKGNHKILTNAVNLPVGASGYIGTTGPTPRVYEELLTIIQSLHTEVASEAALRSAVEQFVDENFHDIVISDVYSKSEIDSMIVTKTVNDLVYYWNKSQTYNRAEIEALIEAAIQGTYIVTQTLPTTDISTHAIYLVPKESATVGDYYDEYINTTGTSAGWEHIGTTEIDLSNYYTKAEINALLDNKVDKVSGKGLSTNDYDNTAKSIVDGVTSALANKVDKETGKGLSTNDYDNTAKGIVDGVTAALAGKVDKETGKGLSTNDYDNTEKAKLAGIAENATKTEASLTNGNIRINGTEKTVYDDTDLSEDITTAQNTANTALAYAQNKVYGMRIRESVESNPASIISYLADAVGMTPVHMDYTNNVFDYGSWEDAWFIKDCKPCILGQDGVVQAYLNKNDYTKDIYGNTVTIDENLTGANVMIEFPKIWYKIVPVVPTCCDADVYFSPVKLDDDYKDFAYIAQDKTHKEHFYMPAYNGSIINDGTNDVLRSLSGQAVGNSKTGTVEIEMAQRNGTGWYTETFSQVTLINLLLMLIGKSTDTQTVFGRGIDTGSQTAFNKYRTGAGNTKGMFWGSNDGTQLVKVFGIENWLSLQWRRFGGLMCVNGTFKYKMCWGQEDGSTTDNYNTNASGYIESPSPAPSGTIGGDISRMFFTTVNMLMSVVSGSSSTKYCDGGWFNNSATTYALRGGSSYFGAVCGAFALNVRNAVSHAAWDLGAALSYT